MRSSVRVAVQFMTNRLRSRLCVRNLPIVVCISVTVSLYLLFGPFINYHREEKLVEVSGLKPKFESSGLSGSLRNLLKLDGSDVEPSRSPVDKRHQKQEPEFHEISTHSVIANVQRKDYATAKPDSSTYRPDLDNHNLQTYIDHNTLSNQSHSTDDHYSHNLLPIRGVLPRVLLVYDNFSVDSARKIKIFLQAQRIDLDLFSISKNRTPPPLSKLSIDTDEVIGRYALILCADVGFLLHRMTEVERRPFFSYSRAFNVSIIAVQRTALDHLRSSTKANFTIGKYIVHPVARGLMRHIKVEDCRPWLLTKGGVTITSLPKVAHWQVFLDHPIRSQNSVPKENHLSLQYLQRKAHESSSVNPNVLVSLNHVSNNSLPSYISHQTSPLALVDRDLAPGVVVVLIGMDLRFWLTKLVLMDMIKAYSTTPLLRIGNERWVMVDIDDIFVAPPGLRMTADDVEVRECDDEVDYSQIPHRCHSVCLLNIFLG